jgi:HEXXH motif-containing protein
VPTPRGVLELPGVGRVDGLAGSPTLVAFDRGRLDPARGRMEPLRTVPLGDGYALEVEDVDPFRGCYHKPAAGRLTEPDVARWAAILTEAWRLLAERAPGYAAELAAGLRALVPLMIEPGDPDVSATSRIAFGAVGLSLPRRPDHLAASLVHEFQHSKLSALLDMIALHGNDPERRYFAPWRRDARPLGGLLQGAYAFLAVGDLWRRLGVERETLDASDRTFPDLCAQLAEVLETLHAAEGLNEVGRRMVAELCHRFDALLGGAVPAEAVTGAATRLERHRQLWREFNHID